MDPTKDNNQYSVLMSVYKNDNSEHLELAIDSMLTQTVAPEQFVIVEDGPVSDEIEKIIEKYEKKSTLFTIVRLKNNGGLGNALNQGLKVCRNELVARMDADDISCPERCEKQLNAFSTNPELCIIGTQIYEFIGTPDNTISCRRVPCDFESIKKFSRRRSPFNHPTVMFRKSAIERLGGYPTLNRKEDLGLFVLAVNEGYYSENLEDVYLFYRTSDDNQKRRKTWMNCKEYIQVMYGFYKNRKIGFIDMTYITIGQLIMFLAPTRITKKLSKMLLRS